MLSACVTCARPPALPTSPQPIPLRQNLRAHSIHFLQVKRTEGISTTDIVGRMLTCTRVNNQVLHEVGGEHMGHLLMLS